LNSEWKEKGKSRLCAKQREYRLTIKVKVNSKLSSEDNNYETKKQCMNTHNQKVTTTFIVKILVNLI